MKPALALVAVLLLGSTALAQRLLVIEVSPERYMGILFVAEGGVSVITDVTVIHTGPPTPPPPSLNPYPEPSAALQEAVKPLRSFDLQPQDGKSFASVFAAAATAIESGKITRVEAVDPFLTAEGRPHGLRGKYDGIDKLLEDILEALLGTTPRNTSQADIAGLRAIAWAMWRE